MFAPAGKRCFTIESLVAKENPLADELIRPTALSYAGPAADALMGGYQAAVAPGAAAAAAAVARSLYPNPAELVFPESVSHPSLAAVGPHSHNHHHHHHQHQNQHLQHHAHFFGSAQHRDPLNFYPWVLRNRFFGHRFQGEGVVPEPADQVQASEAGGRRPGRPAEEEGQPPHQQMAHGHQADQLRGH
ncbi:homeobox protein EMX1 isoform X2 [Vanacampus margaritifer]